MKKLFSLAALLLTAALVFSLPVLAKPPGGIPPGQAKKMGAGATHGGPPPWAPAHGRRAKYNYRYYPGCQVYFDSGRGLYFWLSGGGWQMGAHLPGSITLGGRYVSLGMDASKPYDWHAQVLLRYPPK